MLGVLLLFIVNDNVSSSFKTFIKNYFLTKVMIASGDCINAKVFYQSGS